MSNDSSESDYPPVGGSITPYGGGFQSPCESNICQCLGSALENIGYQLALINATLNDKLRKPCEHIKDCIDEIIEAINDKYGRVVKTCAECRADAEAGLAGTLEYALACAGVVCGECETQCTLGDPTTEGKCCKTCGKEKCVCKDGTCRPVEEEEKKKGKYVGYCDRKSGMVLVLKEDAGEPGYPYVRISVSDDEATALAETNAYCTGYQKQDKPYEPIEGTFPPFGTPLCSIEQFISELGLQGVIGGGLDAATFAAWINATEIATEGLSEFLPFSNPISALINTVRRVATSPLILASVAGPAISQALGCSSELWKTAYSVLAGIGYVEKMVGVDLSEFREPWRYAMHVTCRNRQLDPDKAVAAYFGNAIDLATLDTHWAINGYCPDSLNWYLKAARAKPIPHELQVLRHREIINETEYHNGMRELGYLEPRVRDNLWQATYQLPTMTDILRFMVRDADDETAEGPVNKFDLDAYFESKYGGQLKEWSKHQGIPDKVAQYAWRSHWQIPSPTQLFEFYHRLRKKPEYPDLLGDVKAALIQQDILPYWHRHYLDVSFRPMGRIDIRRSYNIGTMTDEEIEPAYSQLGYSDETAKSLAKFSKQLRQTTALTHKAIKRWLKFAIGFDAALTRMQKDGLPREVAERALRESEDGFETSDLARSYQRGDIARDNFVAALTDHGVSVDSIARIADRIGMRINDHPAIHDFIAGIMTRDNAAVEMVRDGMNETVATRRLDHAGRAMEQSFSIACQRGIKRKYVLGEFTKEESRNELVIRGVTTQRAGQLVDWWDCEKSSQGRAVPTAKLCTWLALGAITSTDFYNRLIKLGYTKENAGLLMSDCLTSISAKRMKLAEKEAKDQAAMQKRAENEAKKQLAREAADLRRLKAMSDKAAKAKINREKQLLSAADKIQKKCDCDIYAASKAAKDQYARLKSDFGMGIDESLKVLLLAVEAWGGPAFSELTDAVNALADTASEVPLETNGELTLG